ncbi:phasin family protein [Microvirga pudoricolor]|uniref:phasin family protein n=1 Tax=Microvirga pudoricolor TaxID=2778729 RepID=UPI00194E448D|nr:phasin family protein [Microvirga pudoricolor]MBM6594207.1 phasin family protein [Microvirga pudoricolor]
MFQPYDQMQKMGQDGLDATMTAMGAFTKASQTIAAETADYAKKAFETGTGTLEKLTGARTLETAIEIQSAYMRTTYEDLVAQSAKMGELYTALAKETFKPFEGFVKKPFAA